MGSVLGDKYIDDDDDSSTIISSIGNRKRVLYTLHIES